MYSMELEMHLFQRQLTYYQNEFLLPKSKHFKEYFVNKDKEVLKSVLERGKKFLDEKGYDCEVVLLGACPNLQCFDEYESFQMERQAILAGVLFKGSHAVQQNRNVLNINFFHLESVDPDCFARCVGRIPIYLRRHANNYRAGGFVPINMQPNPAYFGAKRTEPYDGVRMSNMLEYLLDLNPKYYSSNQFSKNYKFVRFAYL